MTPDTFRQIIRDYTERAGRMGMELARVKARPNSTENQRLVDKLEAERDRCNLIVSELRVEIQRAERSAATLFHEVDALRR